MRLSETPPYDGEPNQCGTAKGGQNHWRSYRCRWNSVMWPGLNMRGIGIAFITLVPMRAACFVAAVCRCVNLFQRLCQNARSWLPTGGNHRRQKHRGEFQTYGQKPCLCMLAYELLQQLVKHARAHRKHGAHRLG